MKKQLLLAVTAIGLTLLAAPAMAQTVQVATPYAPNKIASITHKLRDRALAHAGGHYQGGFKCGNGWVVTSPKYCPEHPTNN